jgi:aarF domain-containing kinase
MLDAHSEAGFAVGTPFAGEGAYDFALHGHLTRRVSALGAVMLRHRLTAPPEEVRASVMLDWHLHCNIFAA